MIRSKPLHDAFHVPGSLYHVQMYPDADAILAVYGCKGTNISGMAQLIYGDTTEDSQACGTNIAAASLSK